MLSRSAQGVYWMSRYLARAEHLCGLLRLQTEALVDRPIGEIHLGWKRIYDSLRQQPPGGSLEPLYNDEFALADSYTLADHLTFERSNPGSMWSCFALGRGERQANAPLHQRGNVDLSQPGLPAVA